MTDAIYETLNRIEAATAEPEMLPPASEGDSLNYLQSIYRDLSLPTGARMRAAIAVLPFARLKLAVTAHLDGSGEFAERLERAIARSGKVIEAGAAKPLAMPAPVPDRG